MAASVEQKARVIAIQESRIFGGIRNTLIGISQFSEIKSGNRESCDKTFALLLDHINNPVKQFLVIGIANINGDTICSVPSTKSNINIADRDYFKRAVASRDFRSAITKSAGSAISRRLASATRLLTKPVACGMWFLFL